MQCDGLHQHTNNLHSLHKLTKCLDLATGIDGEDGLSSGYAKAQGIETNEGNVDAEAL